MARQQTERVVEVPWVLARVEEIVPAQLMDIGAADGSYVARASELCTQMWLVDPRQIIAEHPDNVHSLRFLAQDLPDFFNGNIDALTCVSVLDHVGLDAYGQQAEDGALEAVCRRIADLVCPDGTALITVPFGRDHITTHPGGQQRVFGMAALEALFPDDVWLWVAPEFWRLNPDTGDYDPSNMGECENAEYAEHRAGAVVALELRRKE